MKPAANLSCATLALPPVGRASAGRLPSGKSLATECLVHVKSGAETGVNFWPGRHRVFRKTPFCVCQGRHNKFSEIFFL
jgi:hypothetical protein